MSEKIYALLLRLYPRQFRNTYGNESLQLFRDRSRTERGIFPTLRLWIDLLADFAVSIPLEHRRARLALIGSPVPSHPDGVPSFRVLESDSLRPEAQLAGALLSILAFCSVLLLIGHPARSLPIGTWSFPSANADPASLSAASSAGGPATGDSEADAIASTPSTDRKPASATVDPESPNPAERRRAGFASSPRGDGPPQASAAEPKPLDATHAVIDAFATHNIVMIGEIHGNKQLHDWLRQLVSTPAFDDRVDDIVVEFGNSLYQRSVDRYISGEDVPLEQVQKAWRNVIGAIGPPSPVYEQLYQAVREANLRRRKHQLRIVLGDPYGDWDKIKNAEDLGPYLGHRDQCYAQVVKEEVLARHHRALLIMGSGHLLRRNGPGVVERTLRDAGAQPYLIVFGTNPAGSDLDKRFSSWPRPSVVSLSGTWVGDLPADPVATGGMAPATALKLADAADALLFIGPRDTLTQLRMPRSELDGTAYGKEITRRLTIQIGQPFNFLNDETEVPQFPKPQPQPQQPQPQAAAAGPPPLPPIPKSINDPLPPRPPSQ